MTAALGKLLLLVGCTALGLERGFQLRRRCTCLRGFRAALAGMRRSLRFALCPMSELMAQAETESGEAAPFFSDCRARFAEGGGESWSESWREALEASSLPLEGEDRALLGELGQVLGRYDGENQDQALANLLARLDEGVAAAGEDARRLFRVYATLGVTGGLFAVILL